jgi:hypothetical protein
MAADIGHIAALLNATLDPAQHRKGSRFLPRLFSSVALPRYLHFASC